MVRIFLLAFIIIGIGFIGTYRLWVLKLVNILVPEPIISVTTSIAPAAVAQNVSPHWVAIDPMATSSIPAGVSAASYQIFATSSNSTDYCFARDTNADVIYSVGVTLTLLTGAGYASFVPLDVVNPPSGSYSGCYGKDKNRVYWYTWQDEDTIAGADPVTFTTNADIYPWAKDVSHVYFLFTPVVNADPTTFVAIPQSDYAKDKNHIFYHSGYGTFTKLVVGADPQTFHPFPSGFYTHPTIKENSLYGKDANNIYCGGVVLTGADPATFTQTDSLDAKDKNHTYNQCTLYDPNTAP